MEEGNQGDHPWPEGPRRDVRRTRPGGEGATAGTADGQVLIFRDRGLDLRQFPDLLTIRETDRAQRGGQHIVAMRAVGGMHRHHMVNLGLGKEFPLLVRVPGLRPFGLGLPAQGRGRWRWCRGGIGRWRLGRVPRGLVQPRFHVGDARMERGQFRNRCQQRPDDRTHPWRGGGPFVGRQVKGWQRLVHTGSMPSDGASGNIRTRPTGRCRASQVNIPCAILRLRLALKRGFQPPPRTDTGCGATAAPHQEAKNQFTAFTTLIGSL